MIRPLEIVLATVRATLKLSAKNLTVDSAFVLSASTVAVWAVKNAAVPIVSLFVEIVLKKENRVDAFRTFVDNILVERPTVRASLNVVFTVVETVLIKTPGIVAGPPRQIPVETVVVLIPRVFTLLNKRVPADKIPVETVLNSKDGVDIVNTPVESVFTFIVLKSP